MRKIVIALVLMLGLGVAIAETTRSSTVTLAGLPPIYVTSQGPSGSTVVVSAGPTGGSSKQALVHKWTIAGTETDVLIRLQNTGHGIYIDLVADATITSLSTTVSGMSLTTSSHPAPAKDSTDTAAMVAAGGS